MQPCRRRAIWAAQAAVINSEIKHEQKDETRHDADSALPEVNKFKYACIKCGKEVRRGMYFHQKYCKG